MSNSKLRAQLDAFERATREAPGEITKDAIDGARDTIQALRDYHYSLLGRLHQASHFLGGILALAAAFWALGQGGFPHELRWSALGWIAFVVPCAAAALWCFSSYDKWNQYKRAVADVHRSVEALALSSQNCTMALLLVTALPAASALRDKVVARGEVLRRFHLDAFLELEAQKLQELQRADCRALHIGHA